VSGTGGAPGGTSGSGGSGATGGREAGTPPAECERLDGTSHHGYGTCADLTPLLVTDGVVRDDGGDGRVTPGEGATISVRLTETSGWSFVWYPGVRFETDHSGVELGAADYRYVLGGCETEELTTSAKFQASIPSGTVVHITAQAAMTQEECPSASVLDIPIRIE
jgi:hypothetical protein